ncbi:MAG TPA: hypothetical protein VFO01_17815 [Trebonia sp.]|nr:hypothetical protein [Trebonia sp.]
MRTAREQKEANTVHENNGQDNLKPGTQRWHAQRASARIERDYPWSRPSHAAMSFRLGALYAMGSGQVPV